jgi:ArsR family transcriptional regulator, arsenate/arsenite/antimonite-responsive transcriptional repressor
MNTQIQSFERLFQALGDGTRLRILGLLLTGEVCVCDIHDSLKISQPKASRHLAYLRRAGLVASRREGLWMHYRLAEPRDPLVDTIRQAVIHALAHIDSVRRDADRLQKKTGCCLPSVVGSPILTCCTPEKAPPASS